MKAGNDAQSDFAGEFLIVLVFKIQPYTTLNIKRT